MRYGPGCLNRCQQGENQGEPVPNTPYATIAFICSLFPVPCSLFPVPCSLKFVPHLIKNRYNLFVN
ncbi:MAG: hypothetical protein F6K55_28665 [Moorea sp. SIO4A3]|nr:hypothetical protein [Moorena sp. SIO4A3]